MITEKFLIECRRANGNFNMYWTGKQYILNPAHAKQYATRKGANIALGKVRIPDKSESGMANNDCLLVTPVKIY